MWIAHHRVKVNHIIEMTGRANPLIHRLSIGFAERPWVIVIRSDVRSYRRSDHANSMRMGAQNDLFVGMQNLTCSSRVLCGRDFSATREPAEIIYSFEYDQPTHAGLRKDVPVETRECIGPRPSVNRWFPPMP